MRLHTAMPTAASPCIDDRESPRKFVAMSFDGGGAKGVLSTQALATCFPTIPKLDLVSGISVGSAVAAAVAMGRTPQWIHEQMSAQIPRIFERRGLRSIVGRGGILASRYDSEPLRAALENLIPDVPIRSVPRPLVIAAYGSSSGLTLFTNVGGLCSRRDLPLRVRRDVGLIDALMACMAAPTYFDPVRIGGEDYVDAAVGLGHAGTLAIAVCMQLNYQVAGSTLLSFGTGQEPHTPHRQLGTGLCGWAPRHFGASAQIQLALNQTLLYGMLGRRYVRIDGCLPGPIRLDTNQHDVLACLRGIGRHAGRAGCLNSVVKEVCRTTADADDATVAAHASRKRRRGNRGGRKRNKKRD